MPKKEKEEEKVENPYSVDRRKKQIKSLKKKRQEIMDELFEEGSKRYHQRN